MSWAAVDMKCWLLTDIDCFDTMIKKLIKLDPDYRGADSERSSAGTVFKVRQSARSFLWTTKSLHLLLWSDVTKWQLCSWRQFWAEYPVALESMFTKNLSIATDVGTEHFNQRMQQPVTRIFQRWSLLIKNNNFLKCHFRTMTQTFSYS